MNVHKPSTRTQITMLASLIAFVLPAIWFATIGYIWFVEHVLKFDSSRMPEAFVDRLLVAAATFPIVLVLPVAILVAAIPWMFIMSRALSWADIQFFMKRKGPRVPVVSNWLDRLWLRMIESRRQATPPPGS